MQTLKILVSKSLLILAVLICSSVLTMGSYCSKSITQPKSHTVTIFKMKFTPEHLVIHKGDTVVWINKDFYQHDVTEMTNKKWTSKPFSQGESWSKVITQDVKYYCDLHKVMTGTITIAE